MGGAAKAKTRKKNQPELPQSNIWTNGCYSQALKNLNLPRDFWETEEKRKRISEEYLKLVRQLPTWILSLILEEYDKGIQGRAEETIQAILDEISHRTLLLGEQ